MPGTLCWKPEKKQTQARNSERSDGVHGIVDTYTPRMTAQTLVNELVSVLYPCHPDVLQYRPRILVEIAANTIDMIRISHSSTEKIRKMLLHFGYVTEHGAYQRIVIRL